MLALKLGFFGIHWETRRSSTTRPSFQLGINQVMRRTTTELVDTLGRVRGTSADRPEPAGRARRRSPATKRPGISACARPARNADAKLLPRTRSQAARIQRPAWSNARSRSTRAPTICCCSSTASPATSARPPTILRVADRILRRGWFDPRADDRFWFAYGQLYAYYGILTRRAVDFSGVISERD